MVSDLGERIDVEKEKTGKQSPPSTLNDSSEAASVVRIIIITIIPLTLFYICS